MLSRLRAPRRQAVRAWPRRLLLAGATLLSGELEALAAPLPTPPRGPLSLPDSTLLALELVLNRKPSGRVLTVEVRDGGLLVDAGELRAAGLALDARHSGLLRLDSLPEVETRYEAATQRLLLQVPTHWLPAQRLGDSPPPAHEQAHTSFGALLNYEVYAASAERGADYSSAWSELRLFGEFGTLSHSGVYQHGYSAAATPSRYLRYDSTWRHANERHALAVEVGDLISTAQSWSTPVRLGGVQVSRDFAIRPDIVTYPLPQFSGEAAVPTTLDLFINGYRNGSYQLEPGPFSISNLPFINGAGQAQLVTTDALGRQVSTRVPFYVSSDLLRPGLADFSAALGSLRRNYGLSSFDYGPGAASASLRYGMTPWFTLESHAEGAAELALGGLGGLLRLGNLGVLSGAVGRSRLRGTEGEQLSLGYQYSAPRFNLSLLRTQRNAGYADLALYDQYQRAPPLPGSPRAGHGSASLSRSSTQATLSVSLQRWGSLGGGYFDVEAGDGSRTRLLNLSWSRSLWGNASLHLSATQQIGAGGWSSAAQLVVPFDLGGTLSASLERTADQGARRRLDYHQATPSAGGLGWNLAHADGDQGGRYQQASLTWRDEHLQVQGGAYGDARGYTRWADVGGSLVWIDDAVLAANRIDDAFVVVSTDGHGGIPVHYENQLVGETNDAGHLLVPWSSGYYDAKYSIDTLGLAANIEAPSVERRVAVRSGSGYLLRFPLRRVVAASVELHDTRGRPLPLGTRISRADGGEAYVGWDGLVYLEGLQARNRLDARLPDGTHCRAEFELDTRIETLAQVGPLSCRPSRDTPTPTGEHR
ncbi:fimbria/pilus outer membrane usher protein [Pseudomonas panipatensis]|uniref:fimbria/pilus outer membrane usher protein n=1 Tax=Pseudomonas panipatensis TaxID=428992 RepID=UPI0035B347C2